MIIIVSLSYYRKKKKNRLMICGQGFMDCGYRVRQDWALKKILFEVCRVVVIKLL